MAVTSSPAEHIRALRDRLGWSREQVAVELGVSAQAVQKWELGTRVPSTPTVKLLEMLAAQRQHVQQDVITIEEFTRRFLGEEPARQEQE